MMNEKCAACIHCEVCGFIESEVARDGSCAFYDDGERWIPVSERLPKPKETENLIAKYYLVQNEYGDMMVARWDGKGWEQMYQHEYLEDNVIAWMSLPEPTKAESEETETWNGIHAQITAPKGTFERIFNDADDDNDI